MTKARLLMLSTLIMPLVHDPQLSRAESGHTTRISEVSKHQRTGDKRYPYRAKSQYILKELDLKWGDVVVDIGAGDGWWSERMARFVGEKGIIHAADVDEDKVSQMLKDYADVPQIKPYVCGTDRTGLPENSCDLAFFSQSYHHLNKEGHVAYLKHLRNVVRPTGRVVIIEKYSETGMAAGTHGTRLSRLVQQAEEAGWVPVRLELMTGTYHYIAILAQQDLFPPEPTEERRRGETRSRRRVTANRHTTDSLEMVRQRITEGTAVLVDVREKGEWDAGHLMDAVLVPLSELRNESKAEDFASQLAETVPKDKIIYCHCRSGGRVLAATPILKRLGYDVRPLEFGYNDLLKAGFGAAPN